MKSDRTLFLEDSLRKILAMAIFVVILAGCNDELKLAPPPPDYLRNAAVNEISEREKLVAHFGSAEVINLPESSHEFVVRDTNGVVWYVRAQGTIGTTRLFGWHEEFPRPVPQPVVIETNYVTQTNVVTVTNHVVEDPVTYKTFEK